MINLSVGFDKPFKPFGQKVLSRVVSAADQVLLVKKDITVNVRVSDSSRLLELNKRYAGEDKTTDVLSFNYSEGPNSPIKDKQGDIVISHQHVLSQAKVAKTPPSTELALLVVHGLMHVLGYDHQTSVQTANFEQLQAEIMKAAGLNYRKFDWPSRDS